MASPYRVRFKFITWMSDPEEEIFHEIDGLDYSIDKNSSIFLNDVEYLIKDVKLFIDDKEDSPPARPDAVMDRVLYNIYLDPV